MRAVLLDTDDSYRISELDEPNPGPGQVLIRVSHVGVQWGDVMAKAGRFPAPKPFAPGFDLAGTIVAVGAGVSGERVGQRVAALVESGGYAELALAPAALALPIGELPFAEAAGFGWGGPTAYDIVNTVGRVQKGESVLINAAAGGVGSLAVQYARLAGAARVVGVVGSPGKVDYARRAGYDEVFVGEPGTGGFDVVLDSVGGEASRANFDRLAPFGRLVIYGSAGGDGFSVTGNELVFSNRAVLGYSSVVLQQTAPELFAASAHRALDAVLAGDVRIDITGEYTLDTLDEAVTRMAERKTVGRVVVAVQGS